MENELKNKELPIKLYRTIYNNHDFYSKGDSLFCLICKHSLLYHVENDIKLDKELLVDDKKYLNNFF